MATKAPNAPKAPNATDIRGVAGLLNVSVGGEEYIHLFYNTPKGHLTAEVKPCEKKGGASKTFTATGEVPPGIILKSSQLGAAVKFYGLNLVVGITRRETHPCDKEKYQVSVISPIYQPVATTSFEKSIAVCSSEKDAWVFYLARKDANTVTVKGHTLDELIAFDVDKRVTALENSSLGAYYDSHDNKAYVIYQASEEKDYLFHETDNIGEKNDKITNTSDALWGTPIAVTIAGDGAVCVYYVNNAYKIRKIVKKDGEWGTSVELNNFEAIQKNSQLSVVSVGKVNHLFYAPKKGEKHIKYEIDDTPNRLDNKREKE